MAHCHGGSELYQPVPFDGYRGLGHVRGDCEERWLAIRKHLPDDLSELSFFDYGCAEGFFMFRALQDGAKRAVFIDQDDDCLTFAYGVAGFHGFGKQCEFTDKLPNEPCSIGIYLDVHYNDKTPSLKQFKEKCEVLFISPSGDGGQNSSKLHRELNEVYDFVEPIYNGYQNRTIFRCVKENK